MNIPKKFVLTISITIALAAVWFVGENAKGQHNLTASIASQTQQRIIVAKTHVKAPLEVKAVKNKQREIETDKEFLDDDEWLRGLTIRLANHSGKSVTFIAIDLVFWRTEEQPTGIPAAWMVRVGTDPFMEDPNTVQASQAELAKPGGEVQIALSDSRYDEIQRFLRDVDFPMSVKKLQIQIAKIGFSDGTAWNGRMYRRDPKNVKGPIKGWAPEEDPGSNEPQTRPSGSARRRTAFLYAHHGLDSQRYSKFLKATWTNTPSPAVQCGEAFVIGRGCGNPPPGLTCFYDSGEMIPNKFTDALQPAVRKCVTIINGLEVSCGSTVLTATKIACPSPTPAPGCGPQFDGGGSNSCECDPYNPDCVSPIVIDIAGDGLSFSDAPSGVDFDIRVTGLPQRISWTTRGADDAWLTLDRNAKWRCR